MKIIHALLKMIINCKMAVFFFYIFFPAIFHFFFSFFHFHFHKIKTKERFFSVVLHTLVRDFCFIFHPTFPIYIVAHKLINASSAYFSFISNFCFSFLFAAFLQCFFIFIPKVPKYMSIRAHIHNQSILVNRESYKKQTK